MAHQKSVIRREAVPLVAKHPSNLTQAELVPHLTAHFLLAPTTTRTMTDTTEAPDQGRVHLAFELSKCGDDCSSYPSAVSMSISKSTLAIVALARRLVQGLDEASASGASMTISLDHAPTFSDEGEPWPGPNADEDEDEDDGNRFSPSLFWLTIDRHNLSLEIWERHGDATLGGSVAWEAIGDFVAELDRLDAVSAERLMAVASASLGGGQGPALAARVDQQDLQEQATQAIQGVPARVHELLAALTINDDPASRARLAMELRSLLAAAPAAPMGEAKTAEVPPLPAPVFYTDIHGHLHTEGQMRDYAARWAIATAPAAPAQPGAFTPEWLWSQLMGWCNKRGVSPANHNELFAIVGEAYKLAAAVAPAQAQQSAAAVAAERERCAVLCDLLGGDIDPRNPDERRLLANSLARAIRAGEPATKPTQAEQSATVPADFLSHRQAWRSAIELAMRLAPEPDQGADDKAYWLHELHVFDRAYAELASEPPAPPQAQNAHAAALDLDEPVGRERPRGA